MLSRNPLKYLIPYSDADVLGHEELKNDYASCVRLELTVPRLEGVCVIQLRQQDPQRKYIYHYIHPQFNLLRTS